MPSEVPWEQRIVHESALSRSKQVEVDWKSMRMFACDCYLMGVRTNAPFMCSVLWLAVVGLLVASQQNGPGGTLTEVKLKNCQIPKVKGINGITIKSCIDPHLSKMRESIRYKMIETVATVNQWEFQDPKLEVLYHIRPYFVRYSLT